MSLAETKCSIPLNVSLPPLTIDLERKIEKEGITPKNRKYFIAHWGSFLWNVTNSKPKSKDYSNLTQSIIKTYPILQAGDDGSVSI